jgi:photosystem I P700 chlorophyll a apoprotein A2
LVKKILVIVFLVMDLDKVVLVIFQHGAFYLGVFWVLNTIAWVAFYWHWRHLSLWGFFGGFEGGYLPYGVANHYLWAACREVINGYNILEINAAAVWT